MAQSQRSTLAVNGYYPKQRYARWLRLSIVGAMVMLMTLLGGISPGEALESQYAVTSRAPFNQPQFYPILQTPLPDRYHPIAPWVGRLILPSSPQQGTTDWVWMEVTHTPPDSQDLLGKRVRLEWSPKPGIQQDVALVTLDVKFDPLVKELRRTKADIYPDRLNGRTRVGPLQAIAGARPKDDVTVSLTDATVIRSGDDPPVLQIESAPLLDTGRYYSLVKILGTVAPTKPDFKPKACPGQNPCPSELFRVQHYNLTTRQFDGMQEIVRIPQQPIDGNGVYASTPRDLEKSPAGNAGWYLYGAPDRTGLFTVQAIKPRSLFQLQPQQVFLDAEQGLNYINIGNWHHTEQRKGTLKTALIAPTAKTAEAAIRSWEEGDRALVMHLFGGRGGQRGEAVVLGTVTGHFAYGIAEVMREPLANELQWDIRYYQVYANNIEGVITGENSWTAYMGNLQRGWLGTRPVTDVLVKLDTIVEDYDFGGEKISPLAELTRQLRIITDRYRTGDGTGIASVTAATSCVQDSNQALFLTIQAIRNRVTSSPEIQQWWSSHPQDPTIQRFERLIALGDRLEKELTPFGIVRSDWQSNANVLSGTQLHQSGFTRVAADGPENILTALTSWRTILPRQTQDDLSTLFLRQGAQLWFLNTSQIGGYDPDIVPIAPTRPFGRWTLPGTSIPMASILFTRVLSSIKIPNLQDLGVALGLLGGYGLIALPLGFSQGFLHFKPWVAPWGSYARLGLRLWFMPALVEEVIFRVLFLPDPRTLITDHIWIVWALISLIVFIVYHPFNARFFYKPGNPTFFQSGFLTLAGLLGLTCTIAYWLTHSLFIITLIHWVVVTTWLILFGGIDRLHPQTRQTENTTD